MRQRLLRLPELEVEARGVVPEIDVVGLARHQRLAADDVLGGHLAADVGHQPRAVGVAARHHLNPDIGHLVRRSPAPADTSRRVRRVARVRVRVVELVFHLELRAGRHPERRVVAVLVLPVEVPVADEDQRPPPGARNRRPRADAARAVVRVRLDGAQFGVDRQHVRIGRCGRRRRPARCRCPAARAAGSPACALAARSRNTSRSTASGSPACRSAAGAAARRGRFRARGATRDRSTPAAWPVPASSRGNGRRDSRPSAGPCPRSRARHRPRRAGATPASGRARMLA